VPIVQRSNNNQQIKLTGGNANILSNATPIVINGNMMVQVPRQSLPQGNSGQSTIVYQNAQGQQMRGGQVLTFVAAGQAPPKGAQPIINLTGTSNIVQSPIASSVLLPQQRPPPPLRSAPVQVPIRAIQQVSPTHPAPLPAYSSNWNGNGLKPPPKPSLKISRVPTGIVLSWNITYTQNDKTTKYEDILSYQLFAYQEGSAPPTKELWKKVGDVKALPLPMACTLTQFQEGNRYHFAVRAVDKQNRFSQFSSPCSIHLLPHTDKS